ncbi:hypothetical protein BS47DRAFT_1369013 [Hydnum rufescens UP504]|uniref:Uncharacterized protein n=1 Tax=Hydnum rufescens UP504 TaxID=1448309 RepID=A0A9P6AEB3_9AGAM|nr:hypothetical protein BS47DRAFT_1369013 [Hydnum rufescens UP504]
MDDPNVPMAELERHGVPLHGIRILEPREVHTLDPHAGDLSSESQAVTNGVAERGPDEAHGEFMEIWRMKQDSAMAGALVRVLGPSSISLRDMVPLPPRPPPPPPSPSRPDDMDVEPAVDAPVTSAVDAPLTSAVDAPVTSAVDAPITSAVDAPITSAVDAPVTSAVDAPITSAVTHLPSLLTRSITLDLRKRSAPIRQGWHLEEAQRTPLAAVTTDFPMAFLGIPGPQEHILSIVREAQKKRRVYRSGLEHYVLERWSSAPPGPPGYPKRAKKRRHLVNADQGPRAPGMRPSMDPLEAGHGLVLPSGEKSTLSLSATVLSATVLSETMLSAIALLPRSSLVLLVFSIPPALVQGHLFDVHSPPLVPHVFPTWVLAILWVLLAIVHGLVIVARTLLAIVCHLSITRILVNVACILMVAPLLLTVPCVLLLMTGILVTACLLLALVCVPQCIIHPPPASPHVPPPDRDFPLVQGLHHDRPEPENAMLEDQAPEAQTVSQLPGQAMNLFLWDLLEGGIGIYLCDITTGIKLTNTAG